MQVGLVDTPQGEEAFSHRTRSTLPPQKPHMMSKPFEAKKFAVRPTATRSPFTSVSSKDVRTENKLGSNLCLSVDTTNCSEKPPDVHAQLSKRAAKVLLVQGKNPSPVAGSAPASARLTALLPSAGSPNIGKQLRKPISSKKEPTPPSKIGERVKVFQNLVLSSRSLLKESYGMEIGLPAVGPVRPEKPITRAAEPQAQPYLGGVGFGGRVIGKGGMWLGRWDSFKATEAGSMRPREGEPLGYLHHPAYLRRRSSRNQLTSRPQNRHQARPSPDELSKENCTSQVANDVEFARGYPESGSDERYLQILLERREMPTHGGSSLIANGDDLGLSRHILQHPGGATDANNLGSSTRTKHLFKLNNLSKAADDRGLHFVRKLSQPKEVSARDALTGMEAEDSVNLVRGSDFKQKAKQQCSWDRFSECKEETKYSTQITGVHEADPTNHSFVDSSKLRSPLWRPDAFAEVDRPGQRSGRDKYRSVPQYSSKPEKYARIAPSPKFRGLQSRGGEGPGQV